MATQKTSVPTPGELKKAQAGYASKNPAIKKDNNGVALPHPPRCFKADIFNPKNFKAVDEHAVRAPKELLVRPVKDLIRWLTKPWKTNVEKVRVIFRWFCHQRMAHLGKDYKNPAEAPVDLLIACKVDNSYPEVLKLLMEMADIPCVVLAGQLKKDEYRPGDPNGIGPRRWNAVCIDDDWWFIDKLPNLKVNPASDEGWELLESRGSRASDDKKIYKSSFASNVVDRRFERHDEQNFLIDPHEMIVEQMADEDQWQLLSRTVNRNEFEKLIKTWNHFFRYELDCSSHSEGELKTIKGELKVVLENPLHWDLEFMYELYQWEESAEGKKVKLNRYVLPEMPEKEWRASLRFPMKGLFRFKIYASKVTESKYYPVCAFFITCDEPMKNCKPLPPNTRSHFGPGRECIQFGMIPISHKNGEILDIDGEVDIEFMSREGVEYKHTLESNDFSQEEMKDFVVHRVENGKVVFHAKVPVRGEYTINLFARNGKEGKFVNVCTYLVRSPVAAFNPNDYPSGPTFKRNKIGLRKNNWKIELTPKNHKDTFMRPEKKVKLEFDANMQIEFENKLTCRDQNGVTDMSEHSFVDFNSPLEPVMRCNFPKPGTYHLAIRGKPYGSDEEELCETLADYVFEVRKGDPRLVSFPDAYPDWHEGFRLIEPEEGQLLPDKKVRFLIAGPPDVKDLNLEYGVDIHPLKTKSKGMYEVTITTENKGGTITLRKGETPLLDFEVLSPDGVRDRDNEMKKLEEENDGWTRRWVNRDDTEGDERERFRLYMQRKKERAEADAIERNWEMELADLRRLGCIWIYSVPKMRPEPQAVAKDYKIDVGRMRGLQGSEFTKKKNTPKGAALNTSYMDATIAALFLKSSVVFHLLEDPAPRQGRAMFLKLQRSLRDGVVRHHQVKRFVEAKKLGHFRNILRRMKNVHGVAVPSPDPEQFFCCLIQALNFEPQRKYNAANIEKGGEVQTSQWLFSQAMREQEVKPLPSDNTIEMMVMPLRMIGPGHTKYKRIIPSLSLDPYPAAKAKPPNPRPVLDLFAIICGKEDQFVAFVRCGTDKKAPWFYFNSVSDTKVGVDNSKIPEIKKYYTLWQMLAAENQTNTEQLQLGEVGHYLLQDNWIALYQNSSLVHAAETDDVAHKEGGI